MDTITDFLAAGMKLPALASPPQALPPNSHCAITGQAIQTGYPLWEIMPDTASEYLDFLHGNAGVYISESAAQCLKGTHNMGSWLIFEDGMGYHPLVSIAAATEQDRPCWRDLARQIWPARRGQRCLCILTTDTKRRLWNRARLGNLGTQTVVYVHDPDQNISASVTLDWSLLLTCLELVEELDQHKFTKRGLLQSILRETRALQGAGLSETIEYESRLREWRGRPEFTAAVAMIYYHIQRSQK